MSKNEELLAALDEMNAIRASIGAPSCICEDYWSEVVGGLHEMLPEEFRKPYHPNHVRRAKDDQR